MKKTGFTLVELVITITILVILSTIAFVSFQSYTQDSRDANRLSSLNEINKGLTLSFSKNGSFPTPKNTTTYTGGTISLLQGTLTQEILPELQSDPKDPLSKSSYTYSTTSDGSYFQIASDIENTDVLSQLSPEKSYAKVSSAMVKGNYKMDPILPSLILIPTTSLTNSGIFSPDNCFVTNGGTNTIGNTTCTTKKSMSFKTVDSSLVGYWDMETLSGGKLFDKTGNGNDGIFSGGLTTTNITGALMQKGLYFDGDIGKIEIPYSANLKPKAISMVALFQGASGKNRFQDYPYLITNGDPSLDGTGMNGIFLNVNSSTLMAASVTSTGDFISSKNNTRIQEGTYYLGAVVFEHGRLSVYVNGKKLSTTSTSLPIWWNSEYQGLLFGDANPSGGNPAARFHGVLDEIKIYNRALSAQELEQQAKILGL